MASRDACSDEETPLLQGKSKTPLSWSQISLVFIPLIAEPIPSAYIFSFIDQVRQRFPPYAVMPDAHRRLIRSY